jgi:CDP-glycerol glycerophosphotransferase (TagB/SpsB family)
MVAATPSIHWSIKLHPSENEIFYRDLLNSGLPNFSVLPKSTTLEEAVTRADVACTIFSTAGLEAMIMRRPLVVFDVDPMVYEYAWWPKFGGGTYIHTAEAMLDFVKKASAGGQFLAGLVSKQDQFLTENFANPGRASEAILDMLERVSRTRSPQIEDDAERRMHV